MRVFDMEIPPAAVAAGRAAMTGRFRSGDVAAAVGDALAADPSFDAGSMPPGKLRDEIANRMLQEERRRGTMAYGKGRVWTRVDA